MSIKVALEHRTTYDFAEPVAVAPHVVRLRPAPHARTPIEAYSLDVKPANHFLNWQQDPFGNWLARLVFPEKVSTLDITVGLVADLMVINPFDFFVEEYAEHMPFAYADDLAADLAPYLRPVADSAAADSLPARAAGARQDPHHRLPGHAQRRRPLRGRLLGADGGRRPDPRRDPGPQDRLLPRQRLAPGQPAAPARARGPLRVRLPRAAGRRPEGARRAERHRAGLHRPARLGRGLPPRGRLGRHGPDLQPVRRRGSHSAQRDPAPEQRRADRGRHRPGRGHASPSTTRYAGCTRTRASPSPTPTSSGPASTRSGRPSTSGWWPATCG